MTTDTTKVQVVILVHDDIHKDVLVAKLEYPVEKHFNKQTNHDSVNLLELLVDYIKETEHDVEVKI